MKEEHFYCIKCYRNHIVIGYAGMKVCCPCGAVYEMVAPDKYSPTNNVLYY